MEDLTESITPPAPSNPRPMSVREDCWSEEATSTLIDAWGRRYVELNRGNLRQKDWREVADAVNTLHGHTKKTHRTDVQCKNRIDTVKKKYKTEKARVSSSDDGSLTSSWIFFDRLDDLIGPTLSGKKPSPSAPKAMSPPMALPLPYKKTPTSVAVVAAVALPQKRHAENAFSRRNYSEAAAAAAAAATEMDEEEDEEDEERESEEEEELEEEGEGMRRLAKAIGGFGEVYQRVEAEKLRQMVDLEKQRMQFAKDLEVQRLKMFMDTQVQLERRFKHKQNRAGSSDTYS